MRAIDMVDLSWARLAQLRILASSCTDLRGLAGSASCVATLCGNIQHHSRQVGYLPPCLGPLILAQVQEASARRSFRGLCEQILHFGLCHRPSASSRARQDRELSVRQPAPCQETLDRRERSEVVEGANHCWMPAWAQRPSR